MIRLLMMLALPSWFAVKIASHFPDPWSYFASMTFGFVLLYVLLLVRIPRRWPEWI